jgi:hypothetical protein
MSELEVRGSESRVTKLSLKVKTSELEFQMIESNVLSSELDVRSPAQLVGPLTKNFRAKKRKKGQANFFSKSCFEVEPVFSLCYTTKGKKGQANFFSKSCFEVEPVFSLCYTTILSPATVHLLINTMSSANGLDFRCEQNQQILRLERAAIGKLLKTVAEFRNRV